MVIQRVNREAAERVFIVMQANDANVAADGTVCLETTAASVDGVKVVRGATAVVANHCFVGVADAAIASGAFGLVQVYGYRSTSKVLASNADQALGIALNAASAQVYLSSYASTIGVVPPVVLLESATSSNGTISRKIFLRCM
jgi:hypothetical protein